MWRGRLCARCVRSMSAVLLAPQEGAPARVQPPLLSADCVRSSHCQRARQVCLLLYMLRRRALELYTIGLPIGLELPVQRVGLWTAVRDRE